MLQDHYVKNARISLQYAFPWGQETVDSVIVISDLHQHMDTKQCSELPFSEESKLHAIQIKTDLNKGIRICLGQLTRHQLFKNGIALSSEYKNYHYPVDKAFGFRTPTLVSDLSHW